MSDSDLIAICSLKFYRKKKNWVLAKDKNEKMNSNETNSNGVLNQTYNVNDVNIGQNCLERFTENRKIDFTTKKIIVKNDNYQKDEVDFKNMTFKSCINPNHLTLAQTEGRDEVNAGNMGAKENINLLNSQKYFTLAQVEREDRYICVQNPDVCIGGAQYSMIDQTEANVWANLDRGSCRQIPLWTNTVEQTVGSGGVWPEQCYSFTSELNSRRAETMDLLQRELFQADLEPAQFEEGAHMCRNVGQLERRHQCYQERDSLNPKYLEQLLKPQPLVCQTMDSGNTLTEPFDWRTESDDPLNRRIHSLRLAEMYEQGLVEGPSEDTAQDPDPPFHGLPSQHLMERLLDGDGFWCNSVDSFTFMAGAHNVPHSSEIELRELTPQPSVLDDEAFQAWSCSPDTSEPEKYPTRDVGPGLAKRFDHNLNTQLDDMALSFGPRPTLVKPAFRPRSQLLSLTSRPTVPPGFGYLDDVILAGSRPVFTGNDVVGRGRGRLHRL